MTQECIGSDHRYFQKVIFVRNSKRGSGRGVSLRVQNLHCGRLMPKIRHLQQNFAYATERKLTAGSAEAQPLSGA